MEGTGAGAAQYDTVLAGGELLLPGIGPTAASLAVRDGRIAAILSPCRTDAANVIDISGCIAMPGVIDPHVHWGYGGGSFIERLGPEGESAAIGGVTTAISFHRENGSYDQIVKTIEAAVPTHSLINIGLHLALLTRDHLSAMTTYHARDGITSFKIYMPYKGEEGRQIGIDRNDADDGFITEALEKARELGSTICVHCENLEVIRSAQRRVTMKNAGPAEWGIARPDFAEAEAAMRIAYLGSIAGTRPYLVHISSAETLESLGALAGRGISPHLETGPHYLALTAAEAPPYAKINPPLRGRRDVEALWHGLANGTISTVASDHCPNESATTLSYEAASPGLPGVATLLPVMLSEGVHAGRLSLSRVAEVCSTNAAQIFGLGDRKGVLAPGFDADVAVVDLRAKREVDPSYLRGSSSYSALEGRTLTGWPVLTMVGGAVVMREGEILGSGGGSYLRRPARPPG